MVIFPMLSIGQKVQMVFNGSGVPEELTLVDSNGVRIGYSNVYNKSGILVMSLMYKNGVPNGQWSRYDDKTGKIKESFNYVNGKLNGEHIWYNENGGIIKSVIYNNGTRVATPAQNIWALEVSHENAINHSLPVINTSPSLSYFDSSEVSTCS